MSIQQPDANELTPDEEPQVLSKYEVIRREIAEKMNNHDFELELLSAVNGLDKGLTKSSEFKQQYEREIRELFERMVNEVIPLARELHSRTGKFLKIIRETYANTQLIKEVSDKLEAKMATSVMTDAEISKFLTSSFGFNFEASDESSITWGQGFLEDGEHKYLRIKSLIKVNYGYRIYTWSSQIFKIVRYKFHRRFASIFV